MKTLSRFLICLLVWALCWSNLTYAEQNTFPDSLEQQAVNAELPLREFDEQAMAAYKDQSAFDYSTELAAGPSWFGLFLFWLMSQIVSILGESNTAWLVDNLFQVVIIFTVIIGVFLILRMRFGAVLIGSGERGGAAPVVPELEQEEDYEQLFQQAMNSRDLKLASRYLYIKTLQALHRQGVVKLMKWKTVLEYTEEIPAEKRTLFRKIGMLFESTWYGNYEPSEQDFEEGIASSNQLIS